MSAQSPNRIPIYALLLPRPVVWDVVLLELLGNMVRCWHVGSAITEDRGQLLISRG